MKTMNNSAAQQLSKRQMNDIKGGVSRKEYCDTINMITQHAIDNPGTWDDQQWINATNAYNTHCAAYGL